MELFKKRKYITVSRVNINEQEVKELEELIPTVPEGMWVKCDGCGKLLHKRALEDSKKMCPHCGFYFRLSARERIALITDENSFKELDEDFVTGNPLNFPSYEKKLQQSREKSALKEAVVTGLCSINRLHTVIAVMDSSFIMGSMGMAVGEKISRAVEKAIELKLPLIIFTCSGGARMQEGILSLMQMAKVSTAISRLNAEGLLYVSVLTDPTTGGVTASFAMQGDIILAESGALIGFAGPRVIEQTIKQKLPEGFQRAEFLLEKGFLDKVVGREELKEVLTHILKLHLRGGL